MAQQSFLKAFQNLSKVEVCFILHEKVEKNVKQDRNHRQAVLRQCIPFNYVLLLLAHTVINLFAGCCLQCKKC